MAEPTGEIVRWHPQRGGWLCSDCGRTGALVPAPVRRALARLGSGGLAEAEAVPLEREVNAACRRAIHEVIDLHLASPLKSLEFMMKMSAL